MMPTLVDEPPAAPGRIHEVKHGAAAEFLETSRPVVRHTGKQKAQ